MAVPHGGVVTWAKEPLLGQGSVFRRDKVQPRWPCKFTLLLAWYSEVTVPLFYVSKRGWVMVWAAISHYGFCELMFLNGNQRLYSTLRDLENGLSHFQAWHSNKRRPGCFSKVLYQFTGLLRLAISWQRMVSAPPRDQPTLWISMLFRMYGELLFGGYRRGTGRSEISPSPVRQ